MMDIKVLVAYATKYGATKEIAEKIGAAITEAGLQAEVRDVKHVKDLAAYTAIVLGSAVYVGAWRKEAASFLQDHESELKEKPVWLFSTGPTGEGDPVELVNGFRIPEALKPVAENIKPREIAVFHGAIFKDRLKGYERMMLKMVKAQYGDFRAWDAIKSWGTMVAEALKTDNA